MSSRPAPASFSVGDRVSERPKVRDICANRASPNFDLVARIAHDRRRGTVVDIETKVVKGGARCTYLKILWDGLRQPTSHSVGRISPASDTADAP
jgi:hypothetical protein